MAVVCRCSFLAPRYSSASLPRFPKAYCLIAKSSALFGYDAIWTDVILVFTSTVVNEAFQLADVIMHVTLMVATY